MKRLSTFIAGMVAGALLLMGLLNYHLLRADDGFHLIPKVESRLADGYIDVREFRVADWAQHPQLALALQQAGRQDLLHAAAGDALQNGLDRFLGGRPQDAPAQNQ